MAYTPDTPLDLTNPDDWNYYRQGVISKESGGNINAQNPDSSANGLFQMIKGTRDKYAAGKDWSDPAVQEEAGKAFTADNAKLLQDRGHPVTARNLYLTHFLGGGDAPDVLDAAKSDPTDGISNYVQDSSLAANKSVLGGRSVADVLNWAGGRFNGGGGVTGLMPKAMGQGALSDTPKPTPSAIGGLYDALTGGPGALSAEGPDGLGPIQRFGEGLQGVGAALMARDNPAGAAALRAGVTSAQNSRLQLAQLAMQKQKYAQAQKQDTVLYKGDTGLLMQRQDGTQYVRPIGKDLNSEDTSVNPKDMKMFTDNQLQLNKAAETIDNGQKYAQMLVDGKAHVSWDAKAKTWKANILNDSDANSQANKDIQAYFSKLAADVVSNEKGAGTKFKIEQAGKQYLPSGGESDDLQVASALMRATHAMRGTYNAYADSQKTLAQNNPAFSKNATDLSGKPIGDYGAYQDERQAKWDANHKGLDEGFSKANKAREIQRNPGMSFADKIKAFNKQ